MPERVFTESEKSKKRQVDLVSMASIVVSALLFFCGFFLEDRSVRPVAAIFVKTAAVTTPSLASLVASAHAVQFNVERIDLEDGRSQSPKGDRVVVAAKQAVTVRGWATAGTPPAAADVLLAGVDRQTPLRCSYGSSRPDVATYFHSDAAAASGFSCSLPSQVLPRGKHRLHFYLVDMTHKTYDHADFTADLVVQ